MSLQELKAQLESQQPLKNEAAVLLDQSVRSFPVSDEVPIRDVFGNFDDRWNSLLSIVQQTEMSSWQGDVDEYGREESLMSRLSKMGQSVQEMREVLESLSVEVVCEDDLYMYMEKLQVSSRIPL